MSTSIGIDSTLPIAYLTQSFHAAHCFQRPRSKALLCSGSQKSSAYTLSSVTIFIPQSNSDTCVSPYPSCIRATISDMRYANPFSRHSAAKIGHSSALRRDRHTYACPKVRSCRSRKPVKIPSLKGASFPMPALASSSPSRSSHIR